MKKINFNGKMLKCYLKKNNAYKWAFAKVFFI